MRLMKDVTIPLRGIAASMLLLAAYPSWAEMTSCGVPNVKVAFEKSDMAAEVLVCEAVQEAVTLFDECGLPAFSRPIQITVVDELSEGCVALYHCGEDLIELLSASMTQERRDPESAFQHLSPSDFFQSVVVHELAHAATDDLPCPLASCITADEYIAYAMQVMSLDPKARLAFESQFTFERPVSADELSLIMLLVAPHLFSQKVWAHLSERDDQCEYIGQLMDRSILLDRDRF
jgi:hypothetical protein